MSLQYAPDVVDLYGELQKMLALSRIFQKQQVEWLLMTTNLSIKIAGIPTIDVIPYYPDCTQSSFGPTWHTVSDTMEHIDRTTLQAVGQTLIQLIL